MKLEFLFTFLIVLAMGSKGICQKCAVSDKTDPFTNERTVETDDIKVYGSSILEPRDWGYYLSVKLKGKDFLLCVNDKQNQNNGKQEQSNGKKDQRDEKRGRIYGTTKFDRIMLKLSDNSIIDLSEVATEGSYAQGADWLLEKNYSKIAISDLTKLATLRITVIRLVSNGKNIDTEIPVGKANRIEKLVSCILTYQ